MYEAPLQRYRPPLQRSRRVRSRHARTPSDMSSISGITDLGQSIDSQAALDGLSDEQLAALSAACVAEQARRVEASRRDGADGPSAAGGSLATSRYGSYMYSWVASSSSMCAASVPFELELRPVAKGLRENRDWG